MTCNQDIVGLDVAMRDLALVKIVEGFDDLSSHDLTHIFVHHGASISINAEISKTDEFHDDKDVRSILQILDILDNILLSKSADATSMEA